MDSMQAPETPGNAIRPANPTAQSSRSAPSPSKLEDLLIRLPIDAEPLAHVFAAWRTHRLAACATVDAAVPRGVAQRLDGHPSGARGPRNRYRLFDAMAGV